MYIVEPDAVCLALIAASLTNQWKDPAQVHAGPENLRSLAAILLCNEKGLVKMARRFPDLFSMDPEEVFGRLIELKASQSRYCFLPSFSHPFTVPPSEDDTNTSHGRTCKRES